MGKPFIVSYDFGRHNSDPLGSSSRILEGASWKDQSTVMILPASRTVSALAALSWMNIIPAPNNKFYRFLCQNMEVGEAYSESLNQILANPDLSKWKYVLTVEHDNIPPPTGLLDLYKDMDEHPEYSAIGGLYWIKGEAGIPQIWGDPTDPQPNYRPQVPKLNQVQECCATAMGFTLFRLGMFRDPRMPRPFFSTQANWEGIGTQDMTFWRNARNLGYRCAIDTRIQVGHLDVETGVIW